MLLTQSLGTIRMPCLLGACCVTLLASVGKLILNYNSGNLLWCARKLAAKGLMLLHYFVWLCSLKQQQHFSCTSRSVCCSTWYRTPRCLHYCVHQLSVARACPCEPIRVQNSKILHSDWLACSHSCNRVLWRKLWFPVPAAGSHGFSLSIPTACCFQSLL